MKRLQKAAILESLTEKLRERGSWCGETHLQKAVYLLQDMLEVDLGFDFILYKHGPFSFDLREELSDLQADGLIDLEVPDMRYGPRLLITASGHTVMERYPKTLALHKDQLEFIADRLAARGVADLERLATALFVTREDSNATLGERVQRIIELKPHVDDIEAVGAVEEIDGMLEEAAELVG